MEQISRNNGIVKRHPYFLSAIALILILVVLEIVLQVKEVLWRKYLGEVNSEIVILKPSENLELGYEIKPSVSKTFYGPEGKLVTYTINDQGFRGRRISLEKEDGEVRILVLGDSVSFGSGVNDTETFSSLIDSHFAQGAKKVSIINGAVGGYTTHKELVLLRDKYIAYKPDILILGFCLNDVDPNSDYKFEESIGGSRHSRNFPKTYQGPLGGKFALAGRVLDGSRLWRLVSSVVVGRKDEVGWDRGNTKLFVEGFYNEEGWPKRKEYLRAIKEIADKSGTRMLFVLFPTRYQIDHPNDFPQPQQILSEFAREHQIEYIDLLPRLVELKKPAREFMYDTVHINSRGEKVVADELIAFLENNGWIVDK